MTAGKGPNKRWRKSRANVKVVCKPVVLPLLSPEKKGVSFRFRSTPRSRLFSMGGVTSGAHCRPLRLQSLVLDATVVCLWLSEAVCGLWPPQPHQMSDRTRTRHADNPEAGISRVRNGRGFLI